MKHAKCIELTALVTALEDMYRILGLGRDFPDRRFMRVLTQLVTSKVSPVWVDILGIYFVL